MPTDADEAALGLLGLTAGSPLDIAPTVPLKRKQPFTADDDDDSPSTESISCICGFTYDDGFSIGCDSCQRWCHAACFGIVDSHVPETWECWICNPRHVDRDRAVKLQRARQKAALTSHGEREREKERVAARRRLSPGIERKVRKPSAMDGSKRKRRGSVNTSHQTEDEHVDIDEPWALSYVPIDRDIVPSQDTRDRLKRVAARWRGVTAIEPETIASPPQISLSQVPSSSLSQPFLDGVNHSVRPPSYAVHATTPIPSTKFISPFTSTIIPSTAYLSDPLNSYAHLGMPKPFVHLFGPPLDVALDARIAGDQSRFVRNGCRPNAVLRPMVCKGKHGSAADERTLKFGLFALRDLKANEEIVLGWEWDDGNVIHHLPALIESPQSFPPAQVARFRLQMTSMLHALSSTFTICACGSSAKDCALNRMTAFLDAHTPPTPSPSPPTSHDGYYGRRHADGGRESPDDREDGHERVDLGPLIGAQRGFKTREKVPMSGGMGGVEMVSSPSVDDLSLRPPTPGPSNASQNGAKKQKVGVSPAMSRRVVSEPFDSHTARTRAKGKGSDAKGKGKASAEEVEAMSDPPRRVRRVTIDIPSAHSSGDNVRRDRASPVPMDVDTPVKEECLPPKMRKAWMHRSFEALKAMTPLNPSSTEDEEKSGEHAQGRRGGSNDEEKTDLDKESLDAIQMPPPPLPPQHRAPLTPTTPCSPPAHMRATQLSPPPLTRLGPAVSTSRHTPVGSPAGPLSPSVAFANLSLLSPAIPGRPSFIEPFTRRSTSPSVCSTSAPIPVVSLTPVSPEPASLLSSSAAPAVDSASACLPQSPQSPTMSGNAAPSIDQQPLSAPHSPTLPSTLRFGEAVAGDSDASTRLPLKPPTPPPPPPPPKVKLSLKDFAARKKKQQQEDVRMSSSPKVEANALGDVPATEVQSSTSISNEPMPHHSMELPTQLRTHPEHEDVTMQDVEPTAPIAFIPTDGAQEPDPGPSITDRPSPSLERLPDQPVCEALSSATSLQAKVEMMEASLPVHIQEPSPPRRSPDPTRVVSLDEKIVANGILSRSRSPFSSRSLSSGPSRDLPPHLSQPRFTSPQFRSQTPLSSRSRSPTPPRHSLPRSHADLVRQSSFGQEDGEIPSPPPPKAPPQAPRHALGPPTHPRLFRMPTPPRRPLQPTHPAQNAVSNAYDARPPRPSPYSSRPLDGPRGPRSLPSAPRALRAANSSVPYGSPPIGPAIPPRGPSAGMDRDWYARRARPSLSHSAPRREWPSRLRSPG